MALRSVCACAHLAWVISTLNIASLFCSPSIHCLSGPVPHCNIITTTIPKNKDCIRSPSLQIYIPVCFPGLRIGPLHSLLFPFRFRSFRARPLPHVVNGDFKDQKNSRQDFAFIPIDHIHTNTPFFSTLTLRTFCTLKRIFGAI